MKMYPPSSKSSKIFLSVAKNIANRWTDMVLLYSWSLHMDLLDARGVAASIYIIYSDVYLSFRLS